MGLYRAAGGANRGVDILYALDRGSTTLTSFSEYGSLSVGAYYNDTGRYMSPTKLETHWNQGTSYHFGFGARVTRRCHIRISIGSVGADNTGISPSITGDVTGINTATNKNVCYVEFDAGKGDVLVDIPPSSSMGSNGWVTSNVTVIAQEV